MERRGMARAPTRTAAAVAMVAVSCGLAVAEDARPSIRTNRWQEDWSVLANPALRTQPFDPIKYIPLRAGVPQSYVSFGMTLRERFESLDAASFGIGGAKPDQHVLQRLQIHADAHFDEHWQAFVQLEDARAFGKANITSVDQNPLDLRLAFLAYVNATEQGTFKARVGRQDFDFDLQRFVSSRDGPNVRQSFDALWGDWESGPWRFIGFVSQPVQYNLVRPFDDTSNGKFLFHTFRVERQVLGTNELSAYYSYYQRDNARFLDAAGLEQRHVLDLRFAGKLAGFDWDLEAMGQAGSVGAKQIRAWGAGARVGYTFADVAWQPRIGLQLDGASGDRHRGDDRIETFNPLFPNGYYFSLAGFTGYTNLIHLKPSLTVKPTAALSFMAAIGLQWRATTADAIYVQPNVAVAGTAGQGSLWSGAYAQLRADYRFNANLTGAIEAVHYDIGDTLRHAGGHDSDYIGVELKYAL
ncbi:alginate export family protein [Bradyrhizobium sp. 83012]|uniref:Alginate export family protein n=2 Tax=Bradyrhizobium aeschynomenes TaxID=2734909 RepID=A0ABX2CIY3_9BRAD|nr:alginate export family protein [Bradyrhizobium aeschynomenes]NPV23036.1 alginate export family protein [Bradyrhizobium aeschynomenes]